MSFKSDIEIAREAVKKPIQEIGAKLGILPTILIACLTDQTANLFW